MASWIRKTETNNETNRVYHTKEAIRSALIKRIETENIAAIKTIDIVRDARVSKATFYRYYQDVYDCLVDCFDAYLHVRHELEAFASPEDQANFACALMVEGARKTLKYPKLFLVCITCSYSPFVRDFQFRESQLSLQALQNFCLSLDLSPKNCMLDFATFIQIANDMSTNIMTRWVQGGCLETPENIAQLQYLCLTRLIDAMRR